MELINYIINLDTDKLISLSAILLGVLGIIATIIISYFKYMAEIKKSYFEKIIDCAYKEWEWKTKYITEIKEKGTIYPFNHYLYFYHKFYKLMNKNHLNTKHIKKFYESFHEIENAMEKYSK